MERESGRASSSLTLTSAALVIRFPSSAVYPSNLATASHVSERRFGLGSRVFVGVRRNFPCRVAGTQTRQVNVREPVAGGEATRRGNSMKPVMESGGDSWRARTRNGVDGDKFTMMQSRMWWKNHAHGRLLYRLQGVFAMALSSSRIRQASLRNASLPSLPQSLPRQAAGKQRSNSRSVLAEKSTTVGLGIRGYMQSSPQNGRTTQPPCAPVAAEGATGEEAHGGTLDAIVQRREAFG
ncbi:unnamed protein product [Rangifer tarandus platyrhynchus]|uniref:Uncharacterized protein n=1 Tax=Rangifer tarandus platyrhynchus TaxID=3082113 RepID=A0ABN8XJN6_RANTA|nr:unnamed protein product [Rangifer tarandus platyrhynchus]